MCYDYIEVDWATTDLTILNVVLMWNGGINQHVDGLSTIGALNIFLFQLMHSG